MSYDPEPYWNDRLAAQCNLRGTGHQQYSEQYNAWLYRRKREALRDALDPMSPPGRVLDIGSGIGWVLHQLKDLGATDITGIDIAASAVDRLRREFPDANFGQHAIGGAPLPLPDGSFDLITMLDVAYHIVDPVTFRNAVGDIARLLTPQGRFLFTDGLGSEDRSPAPHVMLRGRPTWESVLAHVDLDLERIGPLYAWLSRDRGGSVLDRLPDGVRGAIEFGLEHTPLRRAHMRWAIARPSRAHRGRGGTLT